MVAAGANIKQISVYMGHTNVRTTMNIYAHLFDHGGERFVEGMDGRPVVVMLDATIIIRRTGGEPPGIIGGRFVNQGRGPAVNSIGEVTSRSSVASRSEKFPVGFPSVDGQQGLEVSGLIGDDPSEQGKSLSYEITVTYEDLGGRSYRTTQWFDDPEDGPPTNFGPRSIPLGVTKILDPASLSSGS